MVISIGCVIPCGAMIGAVVCTDDLNTNVFAWLGSPWAVFLRTLHIGLFQPSQFDLQ